MSDQTYTQGSKMVRYSGSLLKIELNQTPVYFEYKDSSTSRSRRIYCDARTLSDWKSYVGKEEGIQVRGKANFTGKDTDSLYCLGKPVLHRPFQVGRLPESNSQLRYVSGQVLEADPKTGQIVYSQPNGRRAYLTVSLEEAEGYKARIDKMEVVELDGNYKYNRLKRYFERD
ncbi:MAG: hypothetical protein SH817_15900 [Leptospira sp.]|nr:hypothetical protein [Leptospira sp.]